MNRLRVALVVLMSISVLASVALAAAPAEPALWLRYPALSPDGETIAFAYRGDIYLVASAGGEARVLTTHAAHDTRPVWSPDSKTIAFSSDRYGNEDVFVVPAEGGRATRLTFHSADDQPTSFTPDGEAVLFTSGRLDAVRSAMYPTPRQSELYRVALTGGMPARVLSSPALHAVLDRDAKRLAYTDNKGYEGLWRKHDDSSFARDVWLYDIASEKHERLTDFGYDDRQPVFTPDGRGLVYLSERSGSFNVWTIPLDGAREPVQMTRHAKHPVRFLSTASDGTLAYAYDGALYTRSPGASESTKLDVLVRTDGRENDVDWTNVASSISEFALSPNGKEIAFIARGEVFVTAVDHQTTRRITETPEQERSVSFHPDGRTLLYASERDGSWNLYTTRLADDEEPSFFNATALEESVLLANGEETFQPRYSPDGKEVAFLENRVALRVLNVKSGDVRTVMPARFNYSYIDGDQWYEWSPDGRWFLAEMLADGRYENEVALVSSKGDAAPINLSKSGYWDLRPTWIAKGAGMIWASDRHGARMQAGWPAEMDVYAAFFTREAWDRFQLDSAELEQLEEREKKAKKEKKAAASKSEKDDGKKDSKKKDSKKKADAKKEGDEEKGPKLADPVELELEGLEDRKVRLTRHSASIGGAVLTPDGETLVYLARFEKGFDLWTSKRRKGEIKLLAKLGAGRAGGLELDKEGKKAFLLADGRLVSIALAGGKRKPVAVSAKMRLDRSAERAYLFEHVWRQTREKFLDENLHGVDWDFYKTAYAKFLPHIDNNADFAELISEMQGELNASHMGGRHRPTRPDGDRTASLAFFPDESFEGAGLRIAEVIEGSPLERLERAVGAGMIIESIDGETIAAGENWYPLLNRKAGTRVRLGIFDPKSDARWSAVIKPISVGETRGLLYKRWVRSRRAEVERLSGGRLGYAHIRGMGDGPYREVFQEVFGTALGKEGLVLDTRFNGGGNLVEALTQFLTGEKYFTMVPRGQVVGTNPDNRWDKPSIVVMNEGNYSDAHCFPVAYTSLGIGETVGMQVPGTCSSVWWERLQDPSLIFGIPQIAHLDADGEVTENKHLDPDHVVDNDPKLEAEGRDQQLEKAVEVLLEQVDAAK